MIMEEQKYNLIDELMELVRNLDDTSRLDFLDETMGPEYVDEKLAETLEEMNVERLEELFQKYKEVSKNDKE